MSHYNRKTFLELSPEYRDSNQAKFHLLPIPYEGTVCFESGTAGGPDAILDVSDQMEHLDEETHRLIYLPGIFTHLPIPPAESPGQEMDRIAAVVRNGDFFRPGRFPIFLGGEHSISAPLVGAALEKYPGLSVLQFDAHSDLRDTFPPGGRYSHASVMRRILEMTPNIVQVGIRSFSELDLEECPGQVENFITPAMIEEDFNASLRLILSRLTDTVYNTVDMDAFDPTCAPGVGTPEPGGLTWRQVTRILRAVSESKKVIGADVVETVPLGRGHVVTEFMAARLVGKIMAYNH